MIQLKTKTFSLIGFFVALYSRFVATLQPLSIFKTVSARVRALASASLPTPFFLLFSWSKNDFIASISQEGAFSPLSLELLSSMLWKGLTEHHRPRKGIMVAPIKVRTIIWGIKLGMECGQRVLGMSCFNHAYTNFLLFLFFFYSYCSTFT